MYIEFDLTEVYQVMLEIELATWQEKHQIKYNLKVLNKRAKLTFSDSENYTFFCLTWDPKFLDSTKYKIIEPMKVDNTA